MRLMPVVSRYLLCFFQCLKERTLGKLGGRHTSPSEEFGTFKPNRLHQFYKVPDRDRVPYSARPAVEEPGNALGQFILEDNISEL